MNGEEWHRIIEEARRLGGDVQVIFHTSLGPPSLEEEWRKMGHECALKALRNIWFPYAPYGVIEMECDSFTIFGTWILADSDRLISIRPLDEEAKSLLRGMGSNNIESGILRLFSYEMIPEG